MKYLLLPVAVLLIWGAVAMIRRLENNYLWGILLYPFSRALDRLESLGKSFGKWWQNSRIKTEGIGYCLLDIVARDLINTLWIKEIRGLENLPASGSCLVALNHQSYFDFICFSAACPRKVHYLAAEKFFANRKWRLLMRLSGCIRVDRFKGIDRTAYREIKKVVAAGGIIAIFPEGTRSPDGRLGRGKTGVARLAWQTGLPVIPVGLQGTFEIMSRHDRWPKLAKASVNIGEPMVFGKPKTSRLENGELERMTDQIMQCIAELAGEEYGVSKCACHEPAANF